MQPMRRSYETIGRIRKAYSNLYDSSAERLDPGDVRFPVCGGEWLLYIQRPG